MVPWAPLLVSEEYWAVQPHNWKHSLAFHTSLSLMVPPAVLLVVQLGGDGAGGNPDPAVSFPGNDVAVKAAANVPKPSLIALISFSFAFSELSMD